jgi:hypothetical protein
MQCNVRYTKAMDVKGKAGQSQCKGEVYNGQRQGKDKAKTRQIQGKGNVM